MADIIYKLSKRVDIQGKSEILIRIRRGKAEAQIKTGVKIKPQYFDITSRHGGNAVGRIKVPNRSKYNVVDVMDVQEASNRLQSIAAKCSRLADIVGVSSIADSLQYVADISVNDITRDYIDSCVARGYARGFFNIFDRYLQDKQYSESLRRQYLVIIRLLHRWEQFRQRQGDAFALTFDISSDDIIDMKDYMRNEHTLQQQHKAMYRELLTSYPAEISTKHKMQGIGERSDNTISGMIKRIKAYWHWCMAQGIISHDPFKGVDNVRAVYGTPYYLTQQERNVIADYDLSARPALAVQRDIFIFQCLTGCRISDLYALTSANINNGILQYIPRKTSNNDDSIIARVPLTERAQAIINRYAHADIYGRLLPYISRERYNDAIKDILRACGIERAVPIRNALTGATEMRPICDAASSHMARRTFIGNLYSKVQDPNLIGKMSGHAEGSKAFNRYREITDDILQDVIKMID